MGYLRWQSLNVGPDNLEVRTRYTGTSSGGDGMILYHYETVTTHRPEWVDETIRMVFTDEKDALNAHTGLVELLERRPWSEVFDIYSNLKLKRS